MLKQAESNPSLLRRQAFGVRDCVARLARGTEDPKLHERLFFLCVHFQFYFVSRERVRKQGTDAEGAVGDEG